MKIKELEKENRPRERFLKFGASALSDAELLALILRTGTKNENVIEVANRLISEYGLEGIRTCSIKELRKIKGIGEAKAIQLSAITELTTRQLTKANNIKKVSCPEDVFKLMNEELKEKKEEHFFVLMLNNQNIIIGKELVSKGILDAAIIHPREVFKPAIKNSSSKIILIHNHPSGNPSPSNEDLEVINKLEIAGENLGIKVLDFIIIGRDEFWAWREKN